MHTYSNSQEKLKLKANDNHSTTLRMMQSSCWLQHSLKEWQI